MWSFAKALMAGQRPQSAPMQRSDRDGLPRCSLPLMLSSSPFDGTLLHLCAALSCLLLTILYVDSFSASCHEPSPSSDHSLALSPRFVRAPSKSPQKLAQSSSVCLKNTPREPRRTSSNATSDANRWKLRIPTAVRFGDWQRLLPNGRPYRLYHDAT
jgi:hypothetical protein